MQQTLAARLRDAPLKDGSRVKLLFDQPTRPTRRACCASRSIDGETIAHIAAVNDRNVFVSVAPPETEAVAAAEEEDDDEEVSGKPGAGPAAL